MKKNLVRVDFGDMQYVERYEVAETETVEGFVDALADDLESKGYEVMGQQSFKGGVTLMGFIP